MNLRNEKMAVLRDCFICIFMRMKVQINDPFLLNGGLWSILQEKMSSIRKFRVYIPLHEQLQY